MSAKQGHLRLVLSARQEAARMQLAEKCARAKGLMEEAQRIVDEVLEDPGYSPGVLPGGVAPSGVNDYLRDAIAMLDAE